MRQDSSERSVAKVGMAYKPLAEDDSMEGIHGLARDSGGQFVVRVYDLLRSNLSQWLLLLHSPRSLDA